MELVKEPYLPGDVMLNLTAKAKEIRDLINNGTITSISNETGVYVSIDGEIVGGFVYVNESSSWDLYLRPLYNRTLDSNTVVY